MLMYSILLNIFLLFLVALSFYHCRYADNRISRLRKSLITYKNVIEDLAKRKNRE